ncbi:MAG TPA: multiheme c-type cytochrome [Gemmataceae bacterium]|jgi:hypothetical protein|nr:multiheme c-type cytochrome [Gemmataceae bacterium]
MRSKQCVRCLLLLAGPVGLWLTGPQAQTGTQTGGQPPEARSVQALAGTASCSARGCHGAIVPKKNERIEQNENTIWLTQDKHARAYEVLLGQRSEEILAKLNRKPPATEDRQCLACHVTPAAAGDSSRLAREERLSGVGCEACHGYASRWLNEHTTEAWQRKDPAEKHALGMTPPGDWKAFAEKCAGCHIGAPADDKAPLRDMNHDLIAAGHPRLNFELSVYLANLPQHWSDEIIKKRPTDFEVRVWELGQLVSAHAALKLLEDRASQANQEGRPWPELSEYDCYACHHDLKQPSWRQNRPREGTHKPGSLRWGDWYLSMPRFLAARTPGVADTLVPLLNDLSRRMQQPYPNPESVRDSAEKNADKFKVWLDRSAGEYDTKARSTIWKQLLAEGDRVSSWDSAEQVYLALVALNQVSPDPATAQILDKMASQLAFPQDPKRYSSPNGSESDPIKSFEQQLKMLGDIPGKAR